MKDTIRFVFLFLGISFSFGQSPNIVFIMADQWRADAVGYMKTEPVQTPHLDKFSTEGITFTNAVSNTPVCSPARASLMSGMYPPANGVTTNCNSASAPYGVELSVETITWSDVLAQNGYDLAYIGKWHLDSPYTPFVDTYNNRGKIAWNEWTPPEKRHGFRHWIAYGTYDYHLKPMYWNTDSNRDDFYYVDQWGPEFEADRAIEYIANHDGKMRPEEKPFALVVSMNPPHTGYELVPEKYKELYKNLNVDELAEQFPNIPPKGTEMGDYFRNNIANYYACITGVDEHIGRIINQLKKSDLFDNTIIVFTSDHGIQMGANNSAGKDIYYDESMRIPMIISYPSKIKPRTTTLQMSFSDCYATLLSLVGLTDKTPKNIQSFDLSQMLLHANKEREIIQPYYFVDMTDHRTGYRGLRDKRFTFVVHATDGTIDETILFDRQKDPFQMKNIARENPKTTKKYTKLLKKWLKKTNDPFVIP